MRGPSLRPSLGAAVACLAALPFAAGRPVEIDVYHINPYHFGPLPVNMNTGDAAGDLMFDLLEVFLHPVMCSDPRAKDFGFACTNQEASGPDLVANRLHLRVKGNWSDYGECNVGGDNNTDPMGNPCQKGTYCCVCYANATSDVKVPCEATVGRNVLASSAPEWRLTQLCTNSSSPEWLCWMAKVSQKTLSPQRGFWYSSLDTGYCPHHPHSRQNCTWEVVSVDKVINKTCHAASFGAAVEAHNRTCFQGCGAVRNTSSECWVRCFYQAVLGPEANLPGGNVTGIPTEDLIEAWTAPFNSDDPAKGGCPPLPIPSAGLALPPQEREVVV